MKGRGEEREVAAESFLSSRSARQKKLGNAVVLRALRQGGEKEGKKKKEPAAPCRVSFQSTVFYYSAAERNEQISPAHSRIRKRSRGSKP